VDFNLRGERFLRFPDFLKNLQNLQKSSRNLLEPLAADWQYSLEHTSEKG